jgi:hypothetical protein
LRASFVVDLSAFISMFMFLCCFDDFKWDPRWLGRMGTTPFNFRLQSTLKITSVEWMAWDDHHPSLKSQAAQHVCFLIIGQFLMKGMILSQVSSSSNNQS